MDFPLTPVNGLSCFLLCPSPSPSPFLPPLPSSTPTTIQSLYFALTILNIASPSRAFRIYKKLKEKEEEAKKSLSSKEKVSC